MATLVSNVHSVTALSPTAPSVLSATALDYNQVKLTYNEPSGDHWGYDIDISWDAGVTWHWWRRVPTAANTLSWTGRTYSGTALLAGFKAATTYHFRMRTVEPGDDSETFGDWSASASVVTPAYRTASGGGVTVYTVSSNAEWETARDAVKYGDFIDIDADFLVEGSSRAYIPTPQAGGTEGFVTIRTANLQHTPYVRVDAANKTSFGGFEPIDSLPAFALAKSVDRICFESIRFEQRTGNYEFALLACGYDGGTTPWSLLPDPPTFASTLAETPSNIECHGCLFLCEPKTYGNSVAIWADASFIAVHDSVFDTPYDTEGKSIGTAQGAVKWFSNNYFESEAMHILTGGQSPFTDNGVSCVQVHRNYFYRDTAWLNDSDMSVKNLIELKDCSWMNVSANRFQNQWYRSQSFSINLSPVIYKATQCVEKFYFVNNWLANLTGGFTINSGPTGPSSVTTPVRPTNSIQIENNVFHLIQDENWGSSALWGHYASLYLAGSNKFGYTGVGNNLYWRNNVAVNINDDAAARTAGFILLDAPTAGYWEQVVFEDSIGYGGRDGVVKGSSHGVPEMNTWFGVGNWTFRNNCIFTEESPDHNWNSVTWYPAEDCPGCVHVTTSVADLDIVSWSESTPNYRAAASGDLDGTASDGGDIGADIDALEAAIANCITGDWT